MAAKHLVKCKICGETFDANQEAFVMIGRRYAHQTCALSEEDKKSQEEKDKDELYKYITELFQEDFVNPRIQKQIKQYIDSYGYTYSGIRKALIYYYEIKNGDLSKANGGIGIVPYVYKNAYSYYYSLWLAQQKNEDKDIEKYVPKVKTIIIPVPEAKPKKRKLFSFLDGEDN